MPALKAKIPESRGMELRVSKSTVVPASGISCDGRNIPHLLSKMADKGRI